MRRQVVWKRRDGSRIPLERITNSHLLNILEVLRRGEGMERKFPKFKDLILEAERRKLLSVK